MKEDWHLIVTRFTSMCYGCGHTIQKKTVAWNNAKLKHSKHMGCKNKELDDV